MRGCTFENDARLDMRDIAGCIEPSARCVIPPQQQQRLVGEFGKLQFPAACVTVAWRNHGKQMDRCKQPPVIGIISGWNEGEVNIAAFEPIRNAGATIFDQVDIHGWVSAPIGRQKIGEHCLHVLGAATNPQRACLSDFQRACTLTEGLDVLQEPATASQQVLAFGCQFDPAADAIEQGNSKLGLESLNLARSGRLAQVQPSSSEGEAPSFRNDDERLQVSKIHFNASHA
ncbi:hypothetical protein ACVWVY_000891 [Bradyrhizobium sp. URHC0002]